MSTDVERLEEEIKSLKATLQLKEAELLNLKSKESTKCRYTTDLTTEEVVRYSRQMLIPSIQLSGQLLLQKAKVLIVGAGGLGCPSSLYLAAAGVGEIHIIDYDEIELSNLQRQILHYESDIGASKVNSVAEKLKQLNNNIKIVPIHKTANAATLNAYVIQHHYDVILDCSDNVPTRYLLSDISVLHSIPLVSGSALQLEGQLTVYNHGHAGPCYRCLFPTPPPADAVSSCGDAGVLGPITGVIGALQALETIKIVTKSAGVLSRRLLLFDGAESTFRVVALRGKVAGCRVCGERKAMADLDYEQFCGARAHDKVENVDLIGGEKSVGFAGLMEEIAGNGGLLVDVRPKEEFAMCRLNGSENVPLSRIVGGKGLQVLEEKVESSKNKPVNVYLVCRRGNDSQRAQIALEKAFSKDLARFFNVRGGLHAYARHVDPAFPIY